MVEINIQGVEKLGESFSDSKSIIERHLQGGIRRSAFNFERLMKREAPVDTGGLRQSVTHELKQLTAEIAPNKRYAVFVEMGTKPHGMPVGSNPQFQQWARRKGLNPYAVAKSISQKGTKANQFISRSFNKGLPIAQNQLDTAIDNALKEILQV